MTAGASEGPGWGRVRVGVGISFSIVVVGACFLAARRITTTDWPLQQTNVALVLRASAAYLSSFFLRALGWQRLLPGDRPDRSRCLAACGAAAATGAVLPFRLDYVVKIWTPRRLGGPRLDLDTIALSIVLLGLVDAVAMLPLAIAAIATSENDFLAPLIVVLLFCLGCSTILGLGPRLVRLPFVHRSVRVQRSFKRIGDQACLSRATFVAGAFLFGCWSMRALGCTLLLSAPGAGFSPSFALVVICLAAATSILPLTVGGALVNIGATSVVLLALGVAPRTAINFSLASGMLLTFSALAAAIVGAAVSLLLTVQRRHLAHAALA
jgi:lysylphosphatidylglycerol synthase-like protein